MLGPLHRNCHGPHQRQGRPPGARFSLLGSCAHAPRLVDNIAIPALTVVDPIKLGPRDDGPAHLVGAAKALPVGVDKPLLAHAAVLPVECRVRAKPIHAEVVARLHARAVGIRHRALAAHTRAVLRVELGELAKLELARAIAALDARAVSIGDGAVLAQAIVDTVKLGKLPKLAHAHLGATLNTPPIDIGGVTVHALAALDAIELCKLAIKLLALLLGRPRSHDLLERHLLVLVKVRAFKR
mmetsp:Transcript_39428/g.77227  ORF Transcript_39428/g.77227 Transcript_39428/m.77227 type:complete len:241 (-) Transcript_39428:302-1024(-)